MSPRNLVGNCLPHESLCSSVLEHLTGVHTEACGLDSTGDSDFFFNKRYN